MATGTPTSSKVEEKEDQAAKGHKSGTSGAVNAIQMSVPAVHRPTQPRELRKGVPRCGCCGVKRLRNGFATIAVAVARVTHVGSCLSSGLFGKTVRRPSPFQHAFCGPADECSSGSQLVVVTTGIGGRIAPHLLRYVADEAFLGVVLDANRSHSLSSVDHCEMHEAATDMVQDVLPSCRLQIPSYL